MIDTNRLQPPVHPSAPASLLCEHPPAAKAIGSSFYWALRLMPRARRDAMFRIYAFCREIDDIADGADDAATKQTRLQAWRRDVESLYVAAPPSAAIGCLKPVVDDYGLDKADLIAVIDGMLTDASEAVRMADAAAFDLYIDRVASSVGRLSDKVFGLSGPQAERLAHHLGRALQITNILRDLAEDAARNRLYLPLDLLKSHGIDSDDPRTVLAHANLGAVLTALAVRAHEHFAAARAALDQLDATKTRPARMMMAVYSRLLQKLEARGLDRVNVPVRLNALEKLWFALRYGVL
ncbi:presqualene diphosphate synthase HpnD [Magnetovibrio sp.]|uniref:presqualene diphosphate synthase HpnD n=1 Tax=Magnetovibrio sp. TaxID=2024836 RepID=UPI002F92CF83